MNLNSFTQLVENPAVSVFDRSCPKSFPMRIGPLYPAAWELLNFGNSVKCYSAHKTRLMPLVAPAFANLRVQEHAAVVPLRVIMKDYETVFNYAKNREGASLPHLTWDQYKDVIRAMLLANINPVGSLLDFFGLPVFADLYKSVDFDSATFELDEGNVVSAFASNTYASFVNAWTDPGDLWQTNLSYRYRGFDGSITQFVPYVYFLAAKRAGITDLSYFNWDVFRNFFTLIPGAVNPDGSISTSYVPSEEELIAASSFKTIREAVSAYKNYLFLMIFDNMINENLIESDKNYTTLPFRAYWRFHYDWNVNGNFTDRDIMLEENVFNFEVELMRYVAGVLDLDDPDWSEWVDRLRWLVMPVNRLWDDDYWTSLLPTAAVDNAVEIPANSTVLDLAKLTAWQKFVFKLSYSSRYRDVVWNIFKIKPSDARLQQSYPIKQHTHDVSIAEISQTSSSDVSGVLGSFAGRGYSSGLNKGYHIFAEEPCVVFDFVSFVPKSVYADALHPLCHVDDILDFPIPDMDVLGNQPIYADFLSGNPADSDSVFGFGRQYQEWLQSYGQVHGSFKTDLDYWVLTRRFSRTPALNDDFLRIHPEDDVDVIFSVQDTDHAMFDIYYKRLVSRHVHRNVRIKI